MRNVYTLNSHCNSWRAKNCILVLAKCEVMEARKVATILLEVAIFMLGETFG